MSPPIPTVLNLGISAAAMTGACAALYGASHLDGVAWAGCVAAFAVLNNTVFSLLHEATHGLLHPRRAVNDGLGILLAGFFPSGFSMMRAFHLAHHRHNRSDGECFDAILAGESAWLKRLQWYGIISGEYWLHAPLAALLWLVCPWALAGRSLRAAERATVRQHGAAHMLAALDRVDPVRGRLEVVASIIIQVGIWLFLDLNWIGTLVCYAAFAWMWGSLQYADHAFAPRDVRDGAWNLRTTPWMRWLFLNYHHHRAHHQHPGVPWLHLGRYLDHSPRPWFWAIYLRMWLGPRRITEPAPAPDPVLEAEIDAALPRA